MRIIRFSLLAILLLAFAMSVLPGCECNEPEDAGDPAANVRPTVELVMPPPYIEIGDLVYNVKMSWRSNDIDGRVLGFLYRWVHEPKLEADDPNYLPPETTIWTWTEANALDAELDVYRNHTFQILAVDNAASWENYNDYWDGEEGLKYSGYDQELFLDVNNNDVYESEIDECIAYYKFGADEPRQGLTPGVQTPDEYNLYILENAKDIMDKENLEIAPLDTSHAVSKAAVFTDMVVTSSPPTSNIDEYPPEIIFVPKNGGFEEENWLGQEVTISLADIDENNNVEGEPKSYAWAIGHASLLDTLRKYAEFALSTTGEYTVPIYDIGDSIISDILYDADNELTWKAWDWIDLEEGQDVEEITFNIDDPDIFSQGVDPFVEYEYALFVRCRDNAYKEEVSFKAQGEERAYDWDGDGDLDDDPAFWFGPAFNCKRLVVAPATFERPVSLIDDTPPLNGNNFDQDYFEENIISVLGDAYNSELDFVQLSGADSISANSLAAYRAAIISAHSGISSNKLQSESQQALIEEYLRVGGRIWISGQEIGLRFNEAPSNPPPNFRYVQPENFMYRVLNVEATAIAATGFFQPGGCVISSELSYPKLENIVGFIKAKVHVVVPRNIAEARYDILGIGEEGEKFSVSVLSKDPYGNSQIILDGFPLMGVGGSAPQFYYENDKIEAMFERTLIEELNVLQP